jgi:small GTP-binding protein
MTKNAEKTDNIEIPNIDEALLRINNCLKNRSNELNLSGLNLIELPDEIYTLDFIKTLDLHNNPLDSLNQKIGQLISLERIYLSRFIFSQLPESFANLSNLISIHLEGKNIKEFPKQLLNLKKLSYINLSNCSISNLPTELNDLSEITTLWLLNNPITEIKNIDPILNNLIQLSINGTMIVNFNFLDKLKKIENLSIGDSLYLKKLPQEILKLKTLKRFHIGKSKITSITGIDRLINLKEFLILDSKIKTIPKSISKLSLLEDLWFSYCQIKVIPQEIGKLKNLKRLTLYNNSIREIPKEIGDLKNLVELNVNSNNINQIPSEIGKLKDLEKLDVSYNNLIVLPTELSRLEKIKNLRINSNEGLISPPKHINGTEAVLSYLKDLEEEINVWSSKLVIVGEGQVGKSCLVDSLEGKDFVKGKATTHALNLSQFQYQHPLLENIMTLNVWDFGGQDIYHATHQFYLTNHSLFLLVWNARAGYESGKIYKWLETITALAPDSPIFIVATNSSARGADLPKGDISNQYPDKITFFEIDNEERIGIKELKEAIRLKAAELKYMGIGRPKSWINSSSEIKNTSGYHITKAELKTIFQNNGVSLESYESLAGYLHDLGEILYYPDEDELSDTIIIKPEWVSKQIAKILDSDELGHNEGFLDKKHLQELWNDISTNMHNKLITLMEKFDLSYKTKDDKEISLIVEKLKYEENKEYNNLWNQFNSKNQISFKYQLDTIPAGIPTWFIARTHRFSMKIHWRFGVLLIDSNKKNMGLLITSPERKEIWLRVKGETPYYFFAQLRDTLELTFNRFEGLKRPAFVPCPGHNGVPCSHFFELTQLEKRLSLETPRQFIECPEALEDVNVMKLIFGLSFAPTNEILVEKIGHEIEKIIKKENKSQTDELIKFTQLEFVKSYQKAQEIAEITCPNIFTLKEIKKDLPGIDFTNNYKLQLYCQMPGCNHSIGDAYDISLPKKWISSIAPYYNKMLKVLKYTLPLAIPGAKSILEESEFDYQEENISAAQEYGKIISENQINEIPEHSIDMPIRQIRKLLNSVDPKNEWAGLRRIVSPEGHILWLCKEHYAEYKI